MPPATKPKPKKPRPVNQTTIAEFLRIREQRQALQRQADTLDKQQKELAEAFSEFIRQHGGHEKHVTRSGYLLALQSVKSVVPWKQEFIRIAGLKAAEKLAANPPLRDALVIEPIA
jgi:hypothetical protein